MSDARIVETAESRTAQKALVVLSHYAAAIGPQVQHPNLSDGVMGLLSDAYPGLFPAPLFAGDPAATVDAQAFELVAAELARFNPENPVLAHARSLFGQPRPQAQPTAPLHSQSQPGPRASETQAAADA